MADNPTPAIARHSISPLPARPDSPRARPARGAPAGTSDAALDQAFARLDRALRAGEDLRTNVPRGYYLNIRV